MSTWKLKTPGITRNFEGGEVYKDHFAMSGSLVDLILEWEVGECGKFSAILRIRFPRLRTTPNDTHASLEHSFNPNEFPPLLINRVFSAGVTKRVEISSTFTVEMDHGNCTEKREFFPSQHDHATVFEMRTITNTSNEPLNIELPIILRKIECADGHNLFVATQPLSMNHHLSPGEQFAFALNYSTLLGAGNPRRELVRRHNFGEECFDNLILSTPSKELNTMFRLSKLRAAESIFQTANGPVHSPGGYNKYLAAIWANDEAEYANCFFPFLGNENSNAAAINSFRWFMKYMNEDYTPLPSSIIAEGNDTWRGAGDRGDAAMIAHGAARFSLASGSPDVGLEMLPLIEWCLEYCRRKRNAAGVIESDCDELERRFPAGSANLVTSCLFFDALLRTAALKKSLKMSYKKLLNEAKKMEKSIESHFGATVEKFNTYRYFNGNTVLRGWISIPLVFGLTGRKEGTVKALCSKKLWTANGLLTSSDSEVYWDRATLYALRGLFICGESDIALSKLKSYTKSRLLGSHVPYAVEAYPEANASQLSAESALYCRIFIEGLFGIVPTGFNSFDVNPQLPAAWDSAKLEKIKAFGSTWDLELKREIEGIEVSVKCNNWLVYSNTLPSGMMHSVVLP